MSTEIDVAALSGRIVRPEGPVRITVIIEQGRHVETLEIPDPDPRSVQFDFDIQQDDAESGRSSSVPHDGPTRTRVSVSAVAGEGGIIHTQGRRHVAEVLRRIAGEA